MSTLTIRPAPPEPARAVPLGSGRLAHIRRAASELTPQAIEQIAQRVAELLRTAPLDPEGNGLASSRMVNAAQLAKQLGVTRAWVYEHARELGAIQLGGGSRPRLRFDPDGAAEALRRRHEPPVAPSPPVGPTHRARRRPVERAVPLLPLRGNATRGVRSALGAIRRRGCL
jgi:hypothetical protein